MTRVGFIFHILWSVLLVALGAFCASDLWSETFGPGTPWGYGVIFAGIMNFVFATYMYVNANEDF